VPEPSSSPRLSVVICTFNRCADLANALDAVLAQRAAPPHEIIVVDNNSTDDTRRVVEARQQHQHLRYVFEPEPGLPAARNAGIRTARAPIIAFTDDDICVSPDWMAAIEQAFQQFPDADCIGGPILPRWPASGVPEWFTWLQTAPLALQNRGEQPMYVNRDNAAPCLTGANFSFRRTAFDKAGLFAHEFTRSQDRELQLRLWRAGGQGVYHPNVVVHVDVPEDRLTKTHYRMWFRRAGRFHARMRLLEVIDRDGRLVDPPHLDDCFLGAPAYLYSQVAHAVLSTIAASVRGDKVWSFYYENRARYVGCYIHERWRAERVTLGRAIADAVRVVRQRISRRSRVECAPAIPGGAK
jgi:glycosyltransferase involved in cell wall biosynthesis